MYRLRNTWTARLIALAWVLLAGCGPDGIAQSSPPQKIDTNAYDDGVLHSPPASQLARSRFEASVARLAGNVQRLWGPAEVRTAGRTVYVKYTRGYASRAITDFAQGTLSVETLDAAHPQGSLRSAIVAALLTPEDPGAVDMFSDEDVIIDPARVPYLDGLLHDDRGHSVRTPAQALRFAKFLVAQRLQTRRVAAETGSRSVYFVTVALVNDYLEQSVSRYRPMVARSAAKWHVSPSLMLAIMRAETAFNPFGVSPAPAYGLMQLVPLIASRQLYKKITGREGIPSAAYLADPENSIEFGAARLDELGGADFGGISNPDSREYCVIAAYKDGARRITRVFDEDFKAALATINSLESTAVYERLRTGLGSQEARHYLVAVMDYQRRLNVH